MKQGRTLPDLASEIERQANAKRDYLAVLGNGHPDLFVGDAFPSPDIAHGQIADYRDVLKAFYDRLHGTTEELVARNGGGKQRNADQPPFNVIVKSLLGSKGQHPADANRNISGRRAMGCTAAA
jgi:hypothetical protein